MSSRLIILCSALALLAACTTSPTGRSQLVLMPDSQMKQMGLQAFTNIKDKTPVENDRTTNRYVQCVANAITREVGGNWEVVVFRDDSANAFALPGGRIGVNTGLLKVAANQHQLAT
jgi:predicted Zn-dependent protease